MPTCQDCPSFIPESETRVVFRRQIGGPVCKSHGHVLGRPDLPSAAQAKVCESRAAECADYGKPAPVKVPFKMLTPVVLPDPQAVVPPESPATLATCESCAHFVSETVVKNELGWALPLCAAKGTLLIHRQLGDSRGCPLAKELADPSLRRLTTEPWGQYPPILKEGFEFDGHITATGKVFDLNAEVPDPLTYPTDAALSEDDVKDGIRAWWKVGVSPVTGKPLFLPIFNAESFDETERNLIPKAGDAEHPELYVDHQDLVTRAAISSQMDRCLALWGEPGTGKTEFLRHLAYRMQLPFVRMNITRSTELDDLVGKPWLEKDGDATVMKFLDGRLTRWIQKRCLICVDEPNLGPDDVWHLFRPLTDNAKQLVLDQHDGRRLPIAHWCFLYMAMNPSWDVKNIGANEIGEADGNRLLNVELVVPPEAVEKKIIRQACQAEDWDIPEDLLEKIMRIAEDLRAMISAGGLQISWGIRPQLAVALAAEWLPLPEAYRLAVADRLEPQSREQLLGVVNDYVT